MRPAAHRLLSALLIFILIASIAPFKPAHASVYNARPKLIVVIVVDQFRGDYLERYRDQFGAGGFRMLRDKGANFTECYYDYANTHTAPGHATLFTGAYTSGHGIVGNDWYDPERKKFVSSVQDENFKLIGANGTGASPRNLLVTSLGDEMKLATGGKSRVFSVSLKDRSAILPGGRSADGAYWIEKDTGLFVTSSYYRNEMPAWAAEFNAQKKNEKYLNLEWKDAKGKVMRSTAPGQKDLDGTVLGFYDSVGRTPFANDYQLEFIRELIANEKLGAGPATDLLVISLSSYDILGHKVGPDSPELVAMTLALDKQLAEFFAYLGRQVGLANTWIALSADHGVAPMAETAAGYRIPSSRLDVAAFRRDLNTQLLTKTGGAKTANYIRGVKWPIISVADDAFPGMKAEEAEKLVGEAALVVRPEFRGYYTKSQLKTGNVRNDELGRKYLNSYSPHGGSYVMILPAPFLIGTSDIKYRNDTDHSMPFSYDTHVPLVFYGLPFQAGIYRGKAEPVDLAVTLASLLGINQPSHAIGRVLTEALVPARPAASGDNERPRERTQ